MRFEMVVLVPSFVLLNSLFLAFSFDFCLRFAGVCSFLFDITPFLLDELDLVETKRVLLSWSIGLFGLGVVGLLFFLAHIACFADELKGVFIFVAR